VSLALELARRQGFDLRPREPRDGPPGREFDALLYDWDQPRDTSRGLG
jgi:hypothetical protein